MGVNPCAEIALGSIMMCSLEGIPMPLYFKTSESTVDGEKWMTCYIEPEVMYWLKSLHTDLWVDQKNSNWRLIVDMHESLYSMMVLRWS